MTQPGVELVTPQSTCTTGRRNYSKDIKKNARVRRIYVRHTSYAWREGVSYFLCWCWITCTAREWVTTSLTEAPFLFLWRLSVDLKYLAACIVDGAHWLTREKCWDQTEIRTGLSETTKFTHTVPHTQQWCGKGGRGGKSARIKNPQWHSLGMNYCMTQVLQLWVKCHHCSADTVALHKESRPSNLFVLSFLFFPVTFNGNQMEVVYAKTLDVYVCWFLLFLSYINVCCSWQTTWPCINITIINVVYLTRACTQCLVDVCEIQKSIKIGDINNSIIEGDLFQTYICWNIFIFPWFHTY